MFAKQGNCGNKINIKRITLYALLVSICLIVGYLENLLSISLFAALPGIKLGLSNAVALALICSGDIKGGWMVNITRICLSALLFGSTISFLFSLTGGIASTLLASVLSKSKSVSPIGISIASGTAHNIFQCIAASIFIGVGILRLATPILIVAGALCGAFCGVLALILSKRITNQKIFKS